MFCKLLRLPNGWLAAGAAAGVNRGMPVDGAVVNVVAIGNFERAASALNENALASIGFAMDGSELGVICCFGSTVGVVAGDMSSYLGMLMVEFWSSGLFDPCCEVGTVATAGLVASIG